MADKSFNRFF